MKIIRFLFVSFIALTIFLAFNFKWGAPPPIGKFVDPFNGFWQNAEGKRPEFDPEVFSDQLKGKVKVVYDERLVPHITAENDYDLYFAQGYVTAQNRMWQMEIQTTFAAGRLSEILGDQYVKLDREMRRLGMGYGAKNALEVALKDPVVSNMLKAYTAGFNHYLHSLSKRNYPIEYKILDYSPEEWSPLKTCLLLKYMAKDLAGYDNDLQMTNALKVLDKETFGLLFSDNMSPAPEPIIPAGTKWNFTPLTPPAVPVDSFSIVRTNPQITPPQPDNGSNNWAVSGTKTASGAPILANDPHLGLNLPSLWFEIQLTAKDVNVYGASLPGAPGIIIGFNDSIAWGVTNAERYVMDWYKIKFENRAREKYLHNNQWKPVKKVVEEIKVRGQETLFDTVIYTHHGPVSYDQNFYQKNEPIGYACRWLAHDPSLEILSFYKINRAKNYNEFVDALKYYLCPSQNFAFASASGDIAQWVAGKYPLKWKDQGRYLMDGSNPANDWQSFIPFEHSPNIKNPERGFISSANQQPVDSLYPYWSYEGTFEFYRNRRINQVLAANNHIEAQDFMKLQNDNFNLMASESLPFMLSYLDKKSLTTKELGYFNELSKWDYFNTSASEAASVYQTWIDTLYTQIWDEMQSDSLALPIPTKHSTLNLLKTKPNLYLFNIKETPATETAMDMTITSFKQAVAKIEKIKKEKNLKNMAWGKYKATRIRHLLRAIDAFHSDTLLVGGNRNIVNAISPDHGPSWRMIVELGKDINAYGVYPGGQSGNPGSPYYQTFIPHWTAGKYYKLNFYKVGEQPTKTLFRQTLSSK
jgi:penicillin G amidase